MVLDLLDCVKYVRAQPFMSHRPIEAFDIGDLLRLAGLNIAKRDLVLFCPAHQLGTDIFGAVIDPYHLRLPAPLDDLIEASRHPLSRQ